PWWGPTCSELCLQAMAGTCSRESKISEVRAYVGGQVDIDCPYPADYIHVAKYWCRDPCNDADVLVKSETSDTYISKGRFSLYDNSNGRSLSVTIKKLTLKDAGMYYCGVEKWWKDKLRKVHVQVRKVYLWKQGGGTPSVIRHNFIRHFKYLLFQTVIIII
uniref:Ig-like domain-containing protein n=1 Tax=Paramormyrops kingsleyae TaxID=1676925 RepID=A0A3B3TCK5_9TELE